MTTHEREITEPVLLCRPDSGALAPGALGWSRRPLHVCNLRGRPLRAKRWDYWAVLTGDLAVSVTYADIGYLGTATVWWADLATGATGGREVIVPGGRGFDLPDVPGSAPLRFRSSHLDLDLVTEGPDASGAGGGTTITGRWHESDGTESRLDVRVDDPAGHESLNVVIPWSDRLFQYTSKHQARPARGELVVEGRTLRIGDGAPAWGVLDVGRGRWPYSTRWNWGGGAGTADDGHTVVGLQLGGIWTRGTGFTENGVLVDGRLTKIGTELVWDYVWDDPMRPWRVRHPDGSLDVTLTPRFDRHAKVQALVVATEVHQVFGSWTGHVTTDEGREIRVTGIPGFAEESRSRW
ncbi:hypothetical protein N865_00175 [Intrasporangium oryzae NRRL B-24470]|uniref:DUF2804 domain-containing protein n=1 Tax=Intrasporangium oryzae NRRL B-24470 TaxID=1386089 RepID=W9GA94_9MICO|nr:DUF2804 domain-containing protein [Intrasporangium oryzae]EWT02147.1 hypothetical protein N865_00175 [Intrasporangium oryzae NRRL B-24470]